MTMDVRAARLTDVSGIVAVQTAAGRPSIDPAPFEAAIRDPHRLVVVALIDDEIVGWGKTHFWESAARLAPAGHYLGGVTVAPRSRRLGVGVALTDARLQWIWERAEAAYYFTNAQNIPSLQLHSGWGFEEIARAAELHRTAFDGGVGILFRAPRALP
jgi:ribosomal protein S18 acetylase RimI-like enzyme